MRFATLTSLLFAAILRVSAQTSDPAKVASIIAQLQDTPALAAQFNLFSGREVRSWLLITDFRSLLTPYSLQYVFDFNTGIGTTGGSGGNLTIANVVDFPYLYGKGMALSVGKMAYVSPLSPICSPSI